MHESRNLKRMRPRINTPHPRLLLSLHQQQPLLSLHQQMLLLSLYQQMLLLSLYQQMLLLSLHLLTRVLTSKRRTSSLKLNLLGSPLPILLRLHNTSTVVRHHRHCKARVVTLKPLHLLHPLNLPPSRLPAPSASCPMAQHLISPMWSGASRLLRPFFLGLWSIICPARPTLCACLLCERRRGSLCPPTSGFPFRGGCPTTCFMKTSLQLLQRVVARQ